MTMKGVSFRYCALKLSMLGNGFTAVRAVLVGALAVVLALFAYNPPAWAGTPLLPVPISTVPSNGDVNPYGVLFIPGHMGGSLKPGDILVSNFNDAANVMGTGTTIVDIRKGAQLATPFYTAAGTADGLDLALGQLDNFIVVGNVPVTGGTAGAGALTVLNSSGGVVTSLTDPSGHFIDGPWGLAIVSHGKNVTLYVSNLLNASVWRLAGTVSKSGVVLTSETQIGGGYLNSVGFPAAANGPAGLAYDSKHDVLYVASEVDEAIFAISGASKLGTTTTPGTVVYSDATHLHGPTGLIQLGNGDLLTANDDGLNTVATSPSELTEFTPMAPTGTFVTQYSVDPANGGAFGLALLRNKTDDLLAYVDDNAATLSILSLFFK
ncbi:MAG TPA: hypothetical protein VJN94_17880 [Candidatus Binataceae bacterium]|nr:hypothetical protein [Candidatus Binataceae bacterium]